MPQSPCPCGSGKPMDECCGLYLSGRAYPGTAEALMRSRFCAFIRGDVSYLRKTWHPDNCPELNLADMETQWTRLEIIRSKQGLKKSLVEFRAWYLENDTEHSMHEISLFKLYKKRWVYVEPLPGWH
ncbi:YchJ family protein [Microbulbifer litoralis]|uniref:YchJ family protein n=1 Tax=Microbulbifer litoralis TaxID=2933965 RepID=UPI002028A41C|nr:YchJ family metal-binding protein [Microbulbifer sp. GX H0434]